MIKNKSSFKKMKMKLSEGSLDWLKNIFLKSIQIVTNNMYQGNNKSSPSLNQRVKKKKLQNLSNHQW